MNEKQVPVSEIQNMTQGRQVFTGAVLAMARAFYQEVMIDTPGSKAVVSASLLKSVPVLDFVTDGDLALREGVDRGGLSRLSERVGSLTSAQIAAAQEGMGNLVSIASAISFPGAQRLKSYLPVVLPDTRDGLRIVKEITAQIRESSELSPGTFPVESLGTFEQALRLLEDEVIGNILENPRMTAGILEATRSEAKIQLFEAQRRGDFELIHSLRREIAETHMARLKEQKVMEEVEGQMREFSALDTELYRIIEQERLMDRIPEAREQLRGVIEQRKAQVVDTIVRRRVVRKIAGLMLSDGLIRQTAAKLGGLTEQAIVELTGDQGMTVRSQIASQLIDTPKKKLLRLGLTKFPEFEPLIQEEQAKLEQALSTGDPFLFAAQLDSREFELLRARIPNVFRKRMSAENKALFALAKTEFQSKLEAEVTDEEMTESVAQKLFRSYVREFTQELVDRAIHKLPVETEKLIQDPLQLFDFADEMIAEVSRNAREVVVLGETGEERKTGGLTQTREFVMPKITTGKCQLVPAESLLLFGTSLSRAGSLDELAQRIDSSEFAPYFDTDPVFKFYPPERKLEMIFSIAGRGAGSKLAGSPLFVLEDGAQGLTMDAGDMAGETVSLEETHGERRIKNSVRLSPLRGVIGQPFSRNLPQATERIARAIDTVSTNLQLALERTKKDRVSVEEVTEFAKRNLPMFLQPASAISPGREVLQMDFFLFYPPDVRKRMLQEFIEKGTLEDMRDELSTFTREGNMRAAVFDISGGAGGVGITEFLSERLLGTPSGHMDAYLDAVLSSAEARLGKRPRRVAIVPRNADMTLMNFEYVPVEKALKKRGLEEAGISTLELLQAAIEAGDTLSVPLLNGAVMRTDTILKRFTFPNEGKGAGYRGDVFVRLPEGVTMSPLNSSRIVASDKRVNLQIVEALGDELRALGVDPIPSLDIDLNGGSFEDLGDRIIEFMDRQRNAYPEIDFLGAVVKTGDKIPGREKTAGEVISAYPIPPSVFSGGEMKRAFIDKKLRELFLRGVSGVIVQPNIMSLVADNEGVIAPKFEVKMMAFAKP